VAESVERICNMALGRIGVRSLITSFDDAALVYTRRITNPVRFSSAFTDALAFRLAAELALAIPGKTDLEQAMRQRYLLAIAHAKANARNEVQPDQPQDSETIRARL
jgi:hypothetical protein